jgi:alpha-1,3-glucosyltransferase
MTLVLTYLNLSLFLVDNIHFQYNSMMYGIMLLSIVYLLQDRYYMSAFYYAILLNFKHIYLYSAPAYGLIYLKFVYNNKDSQLLSFLRLGI